MKEKIELSDSRFALQYLIEANIESAEPLNTVPKDFIDRNLALIDELKEGLNLEDETVNEMITHYREPFRKVWKHKSILKLIEESDGNDPIEEVKSRARDLVLQALAQGWSGPPFDAIELAKILNYDLSPNDSVIDARIRPLNENNYLIEYNPFQKPTRLNFSIGHEIAHTFFSDCREEIRNREENPTANRELEQLCNIIAAELQLPYVIFPADANAIEDITSISLINLATKYRASLESLLLSFVSAIDRKCAIMICTVGDKYITSDYSKASSKFELPIPQNFSIPLDSRAYLCTAPGITESETAHWSFMDQSYNLFFIGLSPMRRENRGRVAVIIVSNEGEGKLQDRKIKFEYGDATKPRGDGRKIIAHVVNTSAGLGFGFGKSISKNYPEVRQAVQRWKEKKVNFRLGKTNFIQISHDLFIVQMLAQKGLFGKDGK